MQSGAICKRRPHLQVLCSGNALKKLLYDAHGQTHLQAANPLSLQPPLFIAPLITSIKHSWQPKLSVTGAKLTLLTAGLPSLATKAPF